MDQPVPDKSRTIRSVRKRATPTVKPTRTAPEPEPELSNYELLERRSRELEVEHAQGGPGTAQPPDAETPLLYLETIRSQEPSWTTRVARPDLKKASEEAMMERTTGRLAKDRAWMQDGGCRM